MWSELTTERLFLRQPKPADAPFIFLLRSDHEANKFLPGYRHGSEDESRIYLEKIIRGNTTHEWLYWIVETREHHLPAGTACLWNFNNEEERAEVGFAILPEWSGHGFMTEAMKVVMKMAFSDLHLKEVDAFTHPKNLRSIQLLGRLGFVPNAECSGKNGEIAFSSFPGER